MINPSAGPHFKKGEIQYRLVPGSIIEGIFGDASLGLIADHAKERKENGVCRVPIWKSNFCLFFHFLCDMPQDQDHLASDMVINSTTMYTAEEGVLFILCVVHPQINGG
jgi:hypothetical protein